MGREGIQGEEDAGKEEGREEEGEGVGVRGGSQSVEEGLGDGP